MSYLTHMFQSTLPLDMLTRLERIRTRYAGALLAAATGDYSRTFELRLVSRLIGRILAQEARKSPEERGGLRLLDLFLAMDRAFPELRGWNEQHIREIQQERLHPHAAKYAAS